MPKDHSQPINEADRQARAAFREAMHWLSVHSPQSWPLGNINLRTVERMRRGERDVPPGIATELANFLRSFKGYPLDRWRRMGWARALELWAEDCERRMEARHA